MEKKYFSEREEAVSHEGIFIEMKRFPKKIRFSFFSFLERNKVVAVLKSNFFDDVFERREKRNSRV